MWAVMEDVGAMGEGNAVLGAHRTLRRDTLAAASAIYTGKFACALCILSDGLGQRCMATRMALSLQRSR
jgi:hypothetical protein